MNAARIAICFSTPYFGSSYFSASYLNASSAFCICVFALIFVQSQAHAAGDASSSPDVFTSARTLTAPKDDAFYHQLLKLPVNDGYRPTRTFTIVADAEHGNRLVADDDSNLRFNLLWMEQFRPGYKNREGGAALGNIVRSYLKTAYKTYRAHNTIGDGMLPDENGSLRGRPAGSGETDYNLRLTDDEVRVKVEYSF